MNMAGINDRVTTPDQTYEMIRNLAKESDAFNVKVSRRPGLNMPSSIIANLNGASATHLLNPELWLPQLAGGGKFVLQAYHATDLNKPVGGLISFNIDNIEAKEVDPLAPSKTGWQGPAEVAFPLPQQRRSQEDALGYPTNIHSPPGPDAPNSASRSNNGYVRSPGGGFTRPNYDDAGDPNWERTPRGLQAVEAERRKLEEEKLAAERERAKDRLEAQAKAHEAEMKAFRAEMMAELKANKAAAPTGPDPMIEMLKQQAEDRRAAETRAADDRRASETQRSEDRREARAAADAAAIRFEKLLEKLTDRPKENPLEMVAKVAEILHKGNSNEASMKMMHNMAEMHGVQMETAMSFIEHAANLQMGPSDAEPGWVKGLEQVMKAGASVVKGMTQRRPQLAPPPQLPPQGQPQQAPAPAAKSVPVPQQTQAPVLVIDQFVEAIKRAGTPIEIPVAGIAKALREQIHDESLQAAFAEAGGDFERVLQKHLWNWANEKPAHMAYLQALVVEVKRQFVEAGLIEPDPQVPQVQAQGQQEEPEDAEYEEQEQGDDDGDNE